MDYEYDLKIEQYINKIFNENYDTEKSKIYKEQLLQKSLKKYEHLLESGFDKELAYYKVIEEITYEENLSIDNLKINRNVDSVYKNFNRQKYATNIVISVVFYIFSPLTIIIFDEIGQEIIGLTTFFLFIAIATGLLIYTNITNPKPR